METTEQTPPEETPGEEQTEEEKHVPYDRFRQINEERKQLADQLAESTALIEKFKDRDRSETERERVARERVEAENAKLAQENVGLKKGSWVRSAAMELGFHDPEDAVAHLHDKLATLEDSQDAKRAVKMLAKQKEHLIRKEQPEEKRPQIGRILGPDDGGKQTPQRLTPAEEAQQRELAGAQELAANLGQFLDK